MKEKRDETIILRLSKTEKNRIYEKMFSMGIRSLSAYIRKMALDGYCLHLDLKELRRMAYLLQMCKKGDIVHKLKIARGQLDGILQMVEENRYCVDISNQLLATQALLKSANQQILQAHIRSCVREALQTDAVNPKLEEALKLLEKMIQ